MLGEIFRQYTKAELIERFEPVGISYAPINRPTDLFSDPHLLQSGGLLDIELADGSTAKLPALPIEIGGSKLGVRQQPPRIGEHGRDILAELGVSEADAERLIREGIVVAHERMRKAAE
jgi:crotonobetainyl-CoA:carnitine CoA-transferase CaiB-like acyl-CoA transferase